MDAQQTWVVGMDPQLDDLYYAWYTKEKLLRICRICRRDYKRRFVPGYDARLSRLFRNLYIFGAVLFLEDIYYHYAQTHKVLAALQGEILHEARKHSVKVIMVPPRKWQKAILGFATNRDKLEAASKAKGKEITGRDLNAHEADALNIGAFGVTRVAEGLTAKDFVPQYEKT